MHSVTALRSDEPQRSRPAAGARLGAAAPRSGARARARQRGMAAAWLALAAPVALCAPADPGDERALFSDIPSVFAASRFEQPAADAPADVTVITAADIERFGYRTLAEVLRAVRGFSASYDYNYSYLGTRGFAVTGDYNTRLLLLLDGHRLNDNVYNQALLGQEGVLDIALIERIEIVRGPSSSLYGSNALFGVINIVSRRGRDLQGATVRVEANGRGGTAAGAAAGQRLPGGTEYLIAVGAGRDPGEKRLYYSEFAGTPSAGFALDADTDRWRRAFARVRHADLEITAGFSHRLKTLPTAPFSTAFNDRRTQTLDERSFLRLDYNHALGAGAYWELRGSFDEDRFAGDYFQDGPAPVVTRDRVLSRWLALGAEGSQRLGSAHRLVAGLEWERDVLTSFTSTDTYADAAPIRYADIHNGSAHQGVYVQDEWRLRDGLLVSLGLRYDRYRGFPGEMSPRVALVYQFDPETTFKLLYGHAFRAPNLNELHYFDGSSSRANPNLRPEHVRTVELVGAHRFGPLLQATANLYRYRIIGLITQDENREDFLTFGNNAQVAIVGGSLGLEGQLPRGVEWKLGVSRDVPRANWASRDLIVAARVQAKAALAAPVTDLAHLALEALYDGPRHTLAGQRIGGQTLTNVTVTLPALADGVKARLSAYNAFDRRLAVPAGPEFEQTVLIQPRRSVWLNLEASFQ